MSYAKREIPPLTSRPEREPDHFTPKSRMILNHRFQYNLCRDECWYCGRPEMDSIHGPARISDAP
jgi:hypothetical protein